MDSYDEITQRHMATVKEMGILEGEIDISMNDLKEISTDLGMTEDGWNYVMNEANQKLALAESHFKHKSYRECILASEDALLLNPYIKGARGIKSKAYLLLAINEEDDSYLERAKKQAQLTLNKESQDRNAIEVMATVSSKQSISIKDKKNNPNKKLILILGVVMVFLLGIVGIYFISNGSESVKSNSKIENIEIQMTSAFEKQEALIPKVEAFLTNDPKDVEDQGKLNDIKTALENEMSLKEKYELEISLNEILSSIIYRKSSQEESTVLSDLRVLLEGAENRIKTERKNYNDAITNLNGDFEKL